MKTKQRSLGCLSFLNYILVHIYIFIKERERDRVDEDTRFAKNFDGVSLKDDVEPAVELSALFFIIYIRRRNRARAQNPALLTFTVLLFLNFADVKISHENAHEREPGDY